MRYFLKILEYFLMSKKCSLCGELRSFAEFFRRKDGSSEGDGLRSHCKQCWQHKQRAGWQKRIISSSQQGDRRFNRQMTGPFVTEEWINAKLLELNERCFYCAMIMEFGVHYCRQQENGLTIQRFDNALGHTQNNCTLACFWCNQAAKFIPANIMEGSATPFLKRGFLKWCGGPSHPLGGCVLLSSKFQFSKGQHAGLSSLCRECKSLKRNPTAFAKRQKV